MAIVNATPDSFYASSRTQSHKAVAERVTAGDTLVEWRFSPAHLPSIALFVQNRTWFCEAVEEYLPSGTKMWDYESHFFKENGVMVLKKKE